MVSITRWICLSLNVSIIDLPRADFLFDFFPPGASIVSMSGASIILLIPSILLLRKGGDLACANFI